MRNYFRRKIRIRLHNYRIHLNQPDTSLPFHYTGSKKVAVVGGGIAGISAASNLAERGFSVTLFEKQHFLGGKVGSWEFESGGEILRAEHGFHAFFRQYHNLRAFMQKTGSFQHLIPIDDYVIMFGDGKRQGFSGLDPTPGLNVLDLRRHGVFSYLTLVSPFSMPFLHLLKFSHKKTFRRFDNENFEHYARRTLMPARMRLVFNSFARAFFSEPEKMSMAELIKGFHFYFLSNEDGLLYDVLDDDFYDTFTGPCEQFMRKHGVDIRTSAPVEKIDKTASGFRIGMEEFDYVVLCTDVKHTVPLIQNSPGLQQYSAFSSQINALKPSDRYAVYRLWTDKLESQQVPFFVFTDRLQCLDSITFYHRMEKTSTEWSRKNHGGIFELHSYALPGHLHDDGEIKRQLVAEMEHYFPELKNAQVIHSYFQHRQNFPAFHTGLHAQRPGVVTEIPGLYLAGDWVKMDNCSMLMEAAYTSGAIAANHIMSHEGVQENLLESVPVKGIFA